MEASDIVYRVYTDLTSSKNILMNINLNMNIQEYILLQFYCLSEEILKWDFKKKIFMHKLREA